MACYIYAIHPTFIRVPVGRWTSYRVPKKDSERFICIPQMLHSYMYTIHPTSIRYIQHSYECLWVDGLVTLCLGRIMKDSCVYNKCYIHTCIAYILHLYDTSNIHMHTCIRYFLYSYVYNNPTFICTS